MKTFKVETSENKTVYLHAEDAASAMGKTPGAVRAFSVSAAEIKKDLDAKNAEVSRLTRRDMRAGTGPSAEHRAAYRAAKKLWEVWSNTLDLEAGKTPAFPV